MKITGKTPPRRASTPKRRERRAPTTPPKAKGRLDLVVRATNDVLWDWNLITNRVWWNEGVKTVFGYKASQVRPEIAWWESRIAPEDRERVLFGLEAVLRAAKQSWCDEYRFRRADGSHAYVLDRGYIVCNGKGKPVRMIGAMVDLTERKRAEERLQLSEERLSLAVEGAGVGIWHFDVATRELVWSDKCREIFGVQPGHPPTYGGFLDMVHPEDRARVDRAVADAVRLRADYDAEFRIVRPDGGVHWVTARGRGHYDSAGLPVGMEGVVLDITKRKFRQEQSQLNLDRVKALHEIERAITSTLDLRRVLETLLDKIDHSIANAATTVRLVNRETDLLEPVASKNIDEAKWKATFSRVPGGLSQAVLESRDPIIIDNLSDDPRTRHQGFMRANRLVSFLGIPLIAKNGVLGVLAVFTKDRHPFVGEEVEFLTTLAGQAALAIHNAQLYEEMVKANKVKEEFLSVMSHELRTPLSVVMGYAGMLREKMLGDINPQQDEALWKILNRAADQLNMINSIIQTTRLETRAVMPEHDPVNLPAWLAHLRSELEATHDKKEVALLWDCPSDPVNIVIDAGKLRQILHNLIGNALKFTKQGNVTVSAELRNGNGNPPAGSRRPTPPHPSHFLEIKVADTGAGIPADQLALVFDKFYQIDSSETRLYGGLGLGLYIVKRFTELIGGQVAVESRPGKGSTFTVTVPYTK